MFVNALIKDDNVLNIYIHGSQVYGVATEKSDTDYIVIVSDEIGDFQAPLKIDDDDFSIISQSTWTRYAELLHIDFLECLYLDNQFILKETFRPEYKLDPVKIRRSVSAVASNSWVKCCKKLIEGPDYNPYIGKKSLWHSIRILLFGMSIINGDPSYTLANQYYEDIVLNSNTDWIYYKDKYQPLRNQLKSKLKKLAPFK